MSITRERSTRAREIETYIYDRIHGAIADQQLPAGTQLVEENLAEAFAVSRGRIRKVLSRLANDKLVELIPNRGAFIAKPSAEEALQVFEARKVIEAAVARTAAARFDATAARRLRAHVAEEAENRARGDRRRAVRLSGEFHLMVCDIAGNEILTGFLRELVLRSSLIVAVYETPESADCAGDEHERLIDLLAEGDGAAAAAEMTAHLDRIRARLRLVDESPAPVDLRALFSAPSPTPDVAKPRATRPTGNGRNRSARR